MRVWGIAFGVAIAIAPALAHDRITTKVTWHREIAPILDARCVSCHREGGRAPMALTTYEQARPWAKAIKEEVLTRRMPKWHAARGYGDFANDPSLSPFDIALIAAWADGGAPKGVPPPRADEGKGSAPQPPGLPAHGATREIVSACGTRPVAGRLLALRPTLQRGASAGISAVLPGGEREVLAWIRGYDPDFPTTYWLRTPLDLPSGSRIVTEGAARCSIALTLTSLPRR